jgi:lipopolysaccharide/colanic/teichoic acid biosynthesis glycosyltransferase
MLRQLLSRVIAAGALLAVSPLLALCALAIIIEDGRPVFFRHHRIGFGGRPFSLLKLRSMRTCSGGPRITAGGDARITIVGKLLRDYKLDELPQLWNVVAGDMQFVGPRPEVPEYVDLSNPMWQTVLSVPPGITDPTSLVYRNEERLLAQHKDMESFYRELLLPVKLELSAHYVRTRSLATDLRVIVLTLKHVFIRAEVDPNEIKRQFAYGDTLCTK